jgi:hypothetical protein
LKTNNESNNRTVSVNDLSIRLREQLNTNNHIRKNTNTINQNFKYFQPRRGKRC